MKKTIILLLLAALLLGGCGASATPEETPAPAATPGSSLARRPIPEVYKMYPFYS